MRLNEDAPVNAAGGGHVAGIGVGPKGEPGANSSTVIKRTKFAGKDVFKVPTEYFHKARNAKKNYEKYEDYVGNGPLGQAIRDYGRHWKTAANPIIIQDEFSGAMTFLKYGRK